MTETTTAPAPRADIGSLRRILGGQASGVILATVVLTLVIGALHPPFLSGSQLLSVLQSSVYIALIAGGMAYLIAMREIDLSVGSIYGFTGITMAMLISKGLNPWLAAVIGLVVGVLLGAVNATIVRFLAIPLIVTTLATLSVFRGAAIAATQGQPVYGLPVDASFFRVLGGHIGPVPVGVVVAVIVLIPVALALHHTPFGYRVRAIGSNPEAAALAGISVSRVRFQVLILVGFLCAVAAVLGLAFFQSGDPNIGTGYELQAIAAAIIGGTPLRGGSGTVVGAAIGAVLLNVVSSALVYLGIPANWTALATGVVILLAVGIDSLVRARRARSALDPR